MNMQPGVTGPSVLGGRLPKEQLIAPMQVQEGQLAEQRRGVLLALWW